MRTLTIAAIAFLLGAGAIQGSTLSYLNSTAVFPNPERGFCHQVSAPVTASYAGSVRNENMSLIWRLYTVPQFTNTPFTTAFLDQVKADCAAARVAGVKLIIRFSYTDVQDGADAPLSIIQQQLDQLKPVLDTNYDVIAYMDAGFIGAWGEWYYSSNGLNNTASRRTVLSKILSVLPSDRMVVVRTPAYKQAIFQTTTALTPAEAFGKTEKARTGAHNDCFLSSIDDYGTYGNVESEKTFLNLDNRYVPQGGETCNPSTYSVCSNALIDLARMHWSMLNQDYNQTVLSSWTSGGCMTEVQQRLGYRFRLLSAIVPDSARPGGAVSFNMSFVNDGWASPYNPRKIEIILRGPGGKYYLTLTDDPRLWMSGDSATVSVTAGIPAAMPVGTYSAFLHFYDPVPALKDRPEYAIRLANQQVWEDSTGYNSLLHAIIINSTASGSAYSGNRFFVNWGQTTGVSQSRKAQVSSPSVHRNFVEFSPFDGPGLARAQVFDIRGRLIADPFGTLSKKTSCVVIKRPDGKYTLRIVNPQ
jgi:hypothetical protein